MHRTFEPHEQKNDSFSPSSLLNDTKFQYWFEFFLKKYICGLRFTHSHHCNLGILIICLSCPFSRLQHISLRRRIGCTMLTLFRIFYDQHRIKIYILIKCLLVSCTLTRHFCWTMYSSSFQFLNILTTSLSSEANSLAKWWHQISCASIKLFELSWNLQLCKNGSNRL